MKLRIRFGKKSTMTSFGLVGCSTGLWDGWYENYYFGIKGIAGVQIYFGTGIFKK